MDAKEFFKFDGEKGWDEATGLGILGNEDRVVLFYKSENGEIIQSKEGMAIEDANHILRNIIRDRNQEEKALERWDYYAEAAGVNI